MISRLKNWMFVFFFMIFNYFQAVAARVGKEDMNVDEESLYLDDIQFNYSLLAKEYREVKFEFECNKIT